MRMMIGLFSRGYRGAAGKLHPPDGFRIASQKHLKERKPSAKQKKYISLKKILPAAPLLVPKSGFFCSKVNLAPPPSLEYCIRPWDYL